MADQTRSSAKAVHVFSYNTTTKKWEPFGGNISLTVSGQQTDALTDTQLRATAVPISGTVTADLGATDNAVLDAIQAAVENKSTALTTSQWVTSEKSTTDGYIVATPGAGNHLEIYHLSGNNLGANDTIFSIENGNAGASVRHVMLAKEGGLFEAQFNPAIRLSSDTALYYDYISGAAADVHISVHYKIVAD